MAANYEVAALPELPILSADHIGATANIAGQPYVWDGVAWVAWAALSSNAAKALRACQFEGQPVKVIAESGDSREAVKHPGHYLGTRPEIEADEHEIIERDGKRYRVIECLEIMRHIGDPRLATAFKYIWRVAFGGKPQHGKTQAQADQQDIDKARQYLEDYLAHKANESP